MAIRILLSFGVAVAAFVVLSAVSLPFHNEMAFMECKVNHQVTAEDMELLKDRKLPVSHGGKCMLACILKKMKVMTKNGDFDLRSVNKWLRNKYPKDRANLAYGKMVAESCARSRTSSGRLWLISNLFPSPNDVNNESSGKEIDFSVGPATDPFSKTRTN